MNYQQFKQQIKKSLDSSNGQILIYIALVWMVSIFGIMIIFGVYFLPKLTDDNTPRIKNNYTPFQLCISNGGNVYHDAYPRECNLRGEVYKESLTNSFSENQNESVVRRVKINSEEELTNSFKDSSIYSAFQNYYVEKNTEDDMNPTYSWLDPKFKTSSLPYGWYIEIIKFNEFPILLSDVSSSQGDAIEGIAQVKFLKDNQPILILDFKREDVQLEPCKKLYTFSDTNPLYLQARISNNYDYISSGTSPSLTNYEIVPVNNYSEFQLFSKTFRRSGDEIHKDFMFGDDYFDPDCGVTTASFDGLGYAFESNIMEVLPATYEIKINPDVNENILTELEYILPLVSITY